MQAGGRETGGEGQRREGGKGGAEGGVGKVGGKGGAPVCSRKMMP
jgi:hypothetical protein